MPFMRKFILSRLAHEAHAEICGSCGMPQKRFVLEVRRGLLKVGLTAADLSFVLGGMLVME
jgi:hypothetical protein